MKHYRVDLEIGKKKSNSRTIYVRTETIGDAFAIGNKIKYGKIDKISSISFEDYMKGVDKKYAGNTKL